MPDRPIKIVTITYSSSRDTCGNRYHLATFYNVARGRQERVNIETGGDDNGAHLAAEIVGGDWEATLTFNETLPIRRWQALRRIAHPKYLHEGTDAAKAALAALMEPPS